jgi:phosphoglycerate dehydrogenase-like enzyme
MKLRCIIVVDAEYFPQLFGQEELARLRSTVDLSENVPPASLLNGLTNGLETVELILGGWGLPRLDAEVLERLPQLRAVFYAAGTIKPVVSDALWARGIRITNAALENARPAAEFAFAEIILSLKRAWERIFLLREKRVFSQRDPLTHGCYGTTVGLLSLGKIGRLVAEKLRTLDVRVIAYDPFVSDADAARCGVRLCSMEEVFATADVVSCHMPSTPRTQQILGATLFAAMKPGATFINTARGSVVNETDLVAVLRARPDLFAVLDVQGHEPPLPDDPLFTLPNLVLTPHIAGSMGLECRRMGRMMVDELDRYLAGQPLRGEVRREELEMLA